MKSSSFIFPINHTDNAPLTLFFVRRTNSV